MNRRNIIRQSVMVAMVAIMTMTLAGCGKDSVMPCGTDPITGRSLCIGSLEIINEYDGTVSAVYVNDAQNYNELMWQNPPGMSLAYGEVIVFTDVPAGVWSVTVAGETIRGVSIVVGLTTTIFRDSAGNLTAGLPH